MNNIDEIVFENRNKEYGAYSLRKAYKKTGTKSLNIAAIIMLLAVGAPLIASYVSKTNVNSLKNDVLAELEKIDKIKAEIELPPPPPPMPDKMENQVRFVPPIVVDSVETTNVVFSTLDELPVNNNRLDTNVVTVRVEHEPTPDITPEQRAPVVFVEEMPEFYGNLMQYIAENVKYPAIARQENIQGKVYVRFVVTFDGSIDQVSVIRKVDPILEEEAMRVVKGMPKWKPGRQQGRAVSVWYTIPIVFELK